MERTHLKKKDWMRAARIALLNGGPEAVRVERLASSLKVTKGSFYWHFKDRGAILEALLREWEEETSTIAAEALSRRTPREALSVVFAEIKERVVLSERGEAPSDAAIFAWASVSPKVGKRVNKVEQQRIAVLTSLTGLPDRSQLAYLALIGFLMRRRRVPEAAESFPLFGSMLLDFLAPDAQNDKTKSKQDKKERDREKTLISARTR
jgi:AcrR family transcriptional regulator